MPLQCGLSAVHRVVMLSLPWLRGPVRQLVAMSLNATAHKAGQVAMLMFPLLVPPFLRWHSVPCPLRSAWRCCAW